MASAFYDPKYVTEELVDTVEDQLARPGTKAAALAAIRGQRYENVEARYKTIDKPVLLLWGREDRVTTLDFGERLSKELPNAHLLVYPQCGHFPMIEAVKPSTRDVVEFLVPAAPAPLAPKPTTTSEPAPPPAPSSAPEGDPEATR
jgi:pimeloyl-ACP methyl ester carboxylesterase